MMLVHQKTTPGAVGAAIRASGPEHLLRRCPMVTPSVGNAEEWRPIIGFPYEVSSEGRVRRAGCDRVRKSTLGVKGRLAVQLWRDNRAHPKDVHRLVAAAFLGECPTGCEVNHINGVCTDNRVDNLEYTTRTQNMRHAFTNGLIQPCRGEQKPSAKMTAESVREMRAMFDAGASVLSLSKRFRIGYSSARNICRRTKWRHI